MKENKITKDMTISELTENHPDITESLLEEGLFCGGCMMAQIETIEQGAAVHGIDADELVKRLNKELEINK